MRRLLYVPLLVILGLTVVRVDGRAVSPALAAMADTERAFARAAVQKGIRDSFLEYFADDAVALVPEPKPAKDRLRSRPARPFSELELTWEPRSGDVAASGEIGWLTGPSTFIDHTSSPSQPHYGNYLSVWRRRPDGPWRVYIDVGCQVPEPARFPPGFEPLALPERWTGGPDRADASAGLNAADRALNTAIARDGVPTAYARALAEAARLHRQGVSPMVGRPAIVSWLERQRDSASATSAETTVAESAASADLGYSYGLYDVRTTPAERGAYVRLWARDASGRWWLMVEVTEPAS